jgi:hypothetical protein
MSQCRPAKPCLTRVTQRTRCLRWPKLGREATREGGEKDGIRSRSYCGSSPTRGTPLYSALSSQAYRPSGKALCTALSSSVQALVKK